MNRKRAIQLLFVGLAGLTVSLFASQAIGDALPGKNGWSAEEFFYDGWAKVASGLICLLGVYFVLTIPKDSN
jgi:hypothetical protein